MDEPNPYASPAHNSLDPNRTLTAQFSVDETSLLDVQEELLSYEARWSRFRKLVIAAMIFLAVAIFAPLMVLLKKQRVDSKGVNSVLMVAMVGSAYSFCRLFNTYVLSPRMRRVAAQRVARSRQLVPEIAWGEWTLHLEPECLIVQTSPQTEFRWKLRELSMFVPENRSLPLKGLIVIQPLVAAILIPHSAHTSEPWQELATMLYQRCGQVPPNMFGIRTRI